MKMLTRLLASGLLSTGLFLASANATSQQFVTARYNPSNGQATDNWDLSTPAATTINTSISVTWIYGSTLYSAGGSTSISLNGSYYTGTSVGVYAPGTGHNSNSAVGSAGAYHVNHQFGSGGTCYGDLETTLSW